MIISVVNEMANRTVGTINATTNSLQVLSKSNRDKALKESAWKKNSDDHKILGAEINAGVNLPCYKSM